MTSPRTPAPAPAPGRDQPVGLRERKKIKTRIAIRDATYRLIDEQGYEATTVERIAELAEVSPSTVFRYFPTKEDIVISDEFDPLLEEQLLNRPSDESVFDSLRAVMRQALPLGFHEEPEITKLRTQLMLEVASVRSRMLESMSLTGRMICRALAERTGRAEDDLEVRAFAMGIVAGLLETTLYWAERGHRDDLTDLVERTLTAFENGLGL
ncbi:TetR/AcrR family transcriptional regulator [Streptomyces sp. NPDC050560]|uniref:TetR/AcrR family transcriptional regulator n=1 Tax=Streptomyces sp. NPDC050560 TaxID=3365630 RepID=UPI00379C82E6